MVLCRELMSTMSLSGWAAPRWTMLATTPGCGIMAMSGASFAWILVMISWLMLSMRDHLTVMPCFWASASTCFDRPSTTGWSILVQIVTVLLSLPLPPPPQAARDPAATSASVATTDRRFVRIAFLRVSVGYDAGKSVARSGGTGGTRRATPCVAVPRQAVRLDAGAIPIARLRARLGGRLHEHREHGHSI